MVRLMKCYNGLEGSLRFIADITYNYDGEKTVEGLKELIDEVRQEALRALELKEKENG